VNAKTTDPAASDPITTVADPYSGVSIRFLSSGLAALLLAGAPRVVAQTQPLLTEEATAAAGGSLRLEIGADFVHAEPHYETRQIRDRWDGPRLRLVYSPADTVEIDLEWVARVMTGAGPGFERASDFGDVTLRSKLRLRDGGEHGATLGARFTVTLPETSYGQGLGPNTLRMSAQALATLPAGAWRLHANAGLAIHDEVLRAHEQRDFLAYGLALERRVGAFSLLSEMAGLQGDGAPGADARAEARLGVRAGTGAVRWDAALRRGLADADGTWGATAGVVFAWRSR
jgi:hypothetical protein